MIAITKLIMIGIAVVCSVTLAFIVLEFVEDKVKSKFSKKRNRVHFYIARDMDGGLYLYLGKPFRGDNRFCGYILSFTIKSFGLNENDYKDLRWEDEPLEVFLNMED